MRLSRLLVLPLGALACRSAAPRSSSASGDLDAVAPAARPLGYLAAERVIVTPTFALTVAPELGWSANVRTREALRAMDAAIASELGERGLTRNWVMPERLVTSYAHNPTYATDPYALAELPLQSRAFIAGTRLSEPLASQLRTMIALHENTRLVLLPVELRLESAGNGAGRGVLRLTLVDPRFSEARWVGEVRTDTTHAFTPAVLATLAERLGDLIVAP